jgi:hypothetical protein
MCRSIKTLRRPDAAASEREVQEAALQFVRKISGYRVPSRTNAESFEAAVVEISDSSRRLLEALNSSSRPRVISAARLNSKRASR